jgi:excisionase family DNA binding protein
MAKKEQLLTSKDVAHILDMSPDDVIDLARKGVLKGIKQGRRWKFRLSDVQAYKRKQTSEVNTQRKDHQTPKKIQFLNSKEVAHILDMSPSDVSDLALEGKLKAIKQGRLWRFRHSDVSAYAKKHASDLPLLQSYRGNRSIA